MAVDVRRLLPTKLLVAFKVIQVDFDVLCVKFWLSIPSELCVPCHGRVLEVVGGCLGRGGVMVFRSPSVSLARWYLATLDLGFTAREHVCQY